MRCSKCGGKAIASLRQYRMALCDRCYVSFYERMVERSIKRFGVLRREERILSCVSGGKDSAAMASVLKRLGFNVEILHINLGIGEYSAKSERVSEEIAETLDVKINVVRLKDFGFTIDDVDFKKVCSVCGTAKRYIMNRFARTKGFDVVATGHTAEDMILFFIKNVMSGGVEWISKLLPRTEGYGGFVSKARPLFEMGEKENMIYVLARGVPFLADECPHAPRDVWKEIIYDIEFKRPGFKRRFVLGIAKIAERIGEKRWEPSRCERCGEPSSSKICAFCRYVMRFSKGKDEEVGCHED